MSRTELLKKIKKIEIASSILANELFTGNYHSYFKGNGMEFSDIRRYSPGDDVKKIDWKVSARQRKTYVKEFTEERELSIYLMIDISNSNNFFAKKDLISQLAGSLAFSAIKNGDKVGAIFFTDRIEKVIPAKKGRNQSLIILDDLLTYQPTGKKTDIKSALEFFNKIVKRRAILFLISDFIDKDYEKTMAIIKQKHDLIPIRIADKKYDTLPEGAIFNMVDSESGENIIIENFKKNIDISQNISKTILTLYTDDNYVTVLSNFFKRRRRRWKK